MFNRSPGPGYSPSSPKYLSPFQIFSSSSPSHASSRPSSRSPSRSISPDPLGYASPAARPVQSDEALRTVKALEAVLAAWNEYRLAVAQQGRAGRKLASAVRDLGDRNERDGVARAVSFSPSSLASPRSRLRSALPSAHIPDHAIQPTAKTVNSLSDVSLAYAKKLERGYDATNAEAGLYFHNLARQVRDHEMFLANEGKRAMKSGMQHISGITRRRADPEFGMQALT